MKEKIKKNYKVAIVFFVLGIIVSGIVVYAAVIESSDISYDNSTSGLKSTTLKGAVDELYNKVKSNCPDGYSCSKGCNVVSGSKTIVGSEVNCEGENFYISTTGSTTTLIAKYGLNSSYIQSTTPTPANYSDATLWIENYAKNTFSGIKGNISFYGMPTQEELKKISTNPSSSYISGDKIFIETTNNNIGSGKGYWMSSETILVNTGSFWQSLEVSNDATSYGSGNVSVKGNIYARPMIKVTSDVIG